MQKIIPHLWYSKNAEDAAKFYVSIFPDSRMTRVTALPSETPSGPEGSVKVIEFVLFGQEFMAIGAGPLDPFNHAVSFIVNCDDQAEIDRYWEALLVGGEAERCGWLKDKFGLSWQIVPSIFGKLMTDPDKAKTKRACDAMLKMVKLDIDPAGGLRRPGEVSRRSAPHSIVARGSFRHGACVVGLLLDLQYASEEMLARLR